MSRLHEFEEVIGYHFNNQGLLRQALTHSSYANERHMKKHSDNERLEFLGDAVLEVTSSEFLYQKYPDYSEGELTKLRASLVCEPTLAFCTRAIFLDGGFANAKEFVLKYILTDIEHKQLFYDSKTILQEIVQAGYNEELNYQLIREEGPDHDKRFVVEARIGEKSIGEGMGHTKKAAEQEAAYQALLKLKQQENKRS